MQIHHVEDSVTSIEIVCIEVHQVVGWFGSILNQNIGFLNQNIGYSIKAKSIMRDFSAYKDTNK